MYCQAPGGRMAECGVGFGRRRRIDAEAVGVAAVESSCSN